MPEIRSPGGALAGSLPLTASTAFLDAAFEEGDPIFLFFVSALLRNYVNALNVKQSADDILIIGGETPSVKFFDHYFFDGRRHQPGEEGNRRKTRLSQSFLCVSS